MTRIVNIMPMAGLGKRFIDNSYKLPKPLIPINKKPMFIQAAKSMPKSTLNIFICNIKFARDWAKCYVYVNVCSRCNVQIYVLISNV